MRILYLGDDTLHCSALDRARALGRLGHSMRVVNPQRAWPDSRWLNALHYRTGYRLCWRRVRRFVLAQISHETFDVVWVDGGRAVSRWLLCDLRCRAARLVNYNLDDPFGIRDGRCWDTFRQSVPVYDLLCVVRVENLEEARVLRARSVTRVWRGYDPVSHQPIKLSAADRDRWASDVLFVGTWMPERGEFLAELIRRGVRLSIYGNRWEKAPEWPALRRVWRGPGILGADYVKAVQCAKVGLGLLSRGNRDRHTQRSTEIPFIGALLCAERTDEHRQMYAEEREAVFWADASECAERCLRLLNDEAARERIAAAGRTRVCALNISNDEVVAKILNTLVNDSGHRQRVADTAGESASSGRDSVLERAPAR